MKKLMFVLTAVMAFAAVAGEVAAPKGPRGPRMSRPDTMPADPIIRMVTNPKAAEKLGITAEQSEKLKALNNGQKDATKELQKKMREAMSRQAELMKAEKIDEAAVMATIDEVFEVRKEMAKGQTRRLIAVKSILTPEQIEKALSEMRRPHEKRPAAPAKAEEAEKAAPTPAAAPASK